MAEVKTYRRREDKYGYLTLGYYQYIKSLNLYANNIREFEMFRHCFSLDNIYMENSQKYNMLHYFDLKEKSLEIKFLDKETGREVMADTYSLSTTTYLIVRETINYDADLKTTTMVNPANKYEHVTMYSADRVSDGSSLVKIFRNKTDFLTNFNCVYTISDSRNFDRYYQIESDISKQLLKYNNTTFPLIDVNSNKLTNGELPREDFKSNRDIERSARSISKNATSYIIARGMEE